MKKALKIIAAVLLGGYAVNCLVRAAFSHIIFMMMMGIEGIALAIFVIGMLKEKSKPMRIGGIFFLIGAVAEMGYVFWDWYSYLFYMPRGYMISLICYYSLFVVVGVVLIGIGASKNQSQAIIWGSIALAMALADIIVESCMGYAAPADIVCGLAVGCGALLAAIGLGAKPANAAEGGNPAGEGAACAGAGSGVGSDNFGGKQADSDDFGHGPAPMSDEVLRKLSELRTLLSNGIITQEDFNAKRDEILHR